MKSKGPLALLVCHSLWKAIKTLVNYKKRKIIRYSFLKISFKYVRKSYDK